MSQCRHRISELEADHPIPKLARKVVTGDQALVAFVTLTKGCHVARHQHASEQIAIMRHGSARWTVGEEGSADYEEFLARPGDVIVLRANVPHSVDAEEDTEIIDVLTPIGPMGVDSQVDASGVTVQ
jgi:quercetin dioxygenase-like cupin family protein